MPNYQPEEPTFLPINQMEQILNLYDDFTITLTQQKHRAATQRAGLTFSFALLE